MSKTALRASSNAVAALVLGAGLTVLAPSAQAASGADIVSTARSQMGSNACGNGGAGYYAPGTGQTRSCSGGSETHAWCADFAGWAKASGVDAMTITKSEDFKGALEHAVKANKPFLLDVHVDADVRPPPTGTWHLPPTPYKEPAFGERWLPGEPAR